MKVLGVHIGHDSGAALVIDGRIVADVAEERFRRIKHYCGLPIQAIEYCLSSNQLTINDIDAVAIPSEGSVPELNFLLDLKGNQREQFTPQRRMLELAKRILNKPRAKPPIYIKNFSSERLIPIVHVDHHLSHAASAYYTNRTRGKQLIITMDGAGDGYSICVWRGENSKIQPLKKFPISSSLGWFYSNVTEALGWWHGDGEGKTMGLAPYGDSSKIRGILDKYYPKFENGDLIEAHDFDCAYFWNESGALQFHFDEASEMKSLIQKCGRENIAAEAQRVLEEQTMHIILPWLQKEGTTSLSCAGGVFLNVKLNQRIWESEKVTNHHIFPNAGDSGLAVGAALYVYYQNNSYNKFHVINNLYWGPDYSEKEIEADLRLRNLKYQRIENIEEFAAQKLAKNNIIAWFQGRMESGPRALGNRSILMSASKAENKDIINARVKFRESFRPFCPSLLWEKREDYLVNHRDEHFMITSFTCKEDKKERIPAVVHKDGTLRPQTVKKDINQKYWDLINIFGQITGDYVILNTSFNIMGEPIINRPREAIRCFYDNGLDYLIMDHFVLSKD